MCDEFHKAQKKKMTAEAHKKEESKAIAALATEITSDGKVEEFMQKMMSKLDNRKKGDLSLDIDANNEANKEKILNV